MSKFLTPIDLTKNEIRNARMQNLAAAPLTPLAGIFYFDTTLERAGLYTGSVWNYFLVTADKGIAGGVASLDGAALVIQDPASAAITATANGIPKADGLGKIDNGWLKTGAGNGIDADKLDGQDGVYYLNRANHTGTQLAATISDFDNQVRTNRLDQMAAPQNPVSMNNQRITSVATPVQDYDAANKIYVDNAVQGLKAKQSVRVATTGPIASLLGLLTIDGVLLSTDDRVLVKDQTNPAENGIYLAKTGAWVRTNDADTWGELVSAYVFVEEGTVNKDTGWTSTADSGGSLGTSAIPWVQFAAAGQVTASNVGTGGVGLFLQKNGIVLEFKNIAAASNKLSVTNNVTNKTVDLDVVPGNIDKNTLGGSPLSIANGGTGSATAAGARANLGVPTKFVQQIGNGAATNITVNHNLGTTDIVVAVYETAAPYNLVYADIQIVDVNNVSVQFTNPPAANAYKVVVIG